VAIILYVDSDQLYMSAMKLLLEKHGFKVLLARTRDHMKQVLLANMVDAVIVDQDFLRECPQVFPDVQTLSPQSRTVLLGMRNSERPKDAAIEFCARLDGPEKLVQLLQSSAAAAMSKSAHQA
jgi:response regulator RpfG family c-di-GMP phosphodiesterase